MASRRLFLNFKHFFEVHNFYKHNSVLLTRDFCCLSRFWPDSLNRLSVIYTPANFGQTRNYPKGKEKIKNSAKKVEIREDMLAEHINLKKFKTEMENAVNLVREQFIKNVSLRSNAGSIESLQVEFEGQKYTIRDLAQINRKNPKLLALNFSNFPQTIPAVIQVLNESGMNLNPQQDGTSLYIPIPKVTREHREKLAKNANAIFNKFKINVKDIHSMQMKKLEAQKNEGLSQEMFFILRDQLAALVSKYVSEGEKMKMDKTKELLGES